MTEERQFPQGSRVDDLDLSGVHLHGASLEAARLTDTFLRGADISGDITGVRINDVDIEPLVEAELDRRFPERVQLRSASIDGLRAAWSMLEDLWSATTARASDLDEEQQTRRVDGEWSFVETLRHLICATDCWLFRGIQLAPRPYHPWGLLFSGSDAAWAASLGIDTAATPSLRDVLPVRRAHQGAVRAELDRLSDGELLEVRTAPGTPGHPNGEHSVLQCLHVILNEEWEHHRYAIRDLGAIEGGAASQR
jgi:DinB superfamily/Pentapeptide repeats (8 copies)